MQRACNFNLDLRQYIGHSMEKSSKIRAVLKREGIKYTYKVNDPSAQWLGPGSSRGNVGSFGMNKKLEKQYVIYVKIKDVENAKYFIHSILNS